MTETASQRRLSAIMAADVVGYSRQMGENERRTLDYVRGLRRDILDPQIAAFNGRLVKAMGDGFLVEFSSAADAVVCALAIQEAIPALNAAQGSSLQLRIGINLGDVIFEDGDIFGEGVNIAARLESIAEPGTVCISKDVHHLVRKSVDRVFEDLGPQQLKNIDDPVSAFLLRPGDRGPGRDAGKTPISKRPAVAVLPFDNMSGDPSQDYFSDGLTEDIISALSHWRSIPVIARNSTFTYKGKSVRVQQIAKELGVRYILEGSVRRSGERVRVTAQLIEAESGHHVWAEKFDRRMEDIFDVQDEITSCITATLVPELEHFENRRASTKPTEDLTAWDFYLRGIARFYEDTCAGTAAAKRMFQAAVEADPNYADAWARLGWCHSREVMFGCTADRRASIAKGFEAARRAVVLDSASAIAHMSLGTVYIWAEETALGLAEAQRAIDLNPNFAEAAMAVGNRLDLVGRTEEGIAQMERSLTLNPRDPARWRYMAYLSRAYISLGDLERARDWSEQAVMLRPDLPEALFRHALVLAHRDLVDEARDALRRCNEIDPTYLAQKVGWQPYPDASRSALIMEGLQRHGLIPG